MVKPRVCEVHRVPHHGSSDLDHSWLPLVDGKILFNRNREDGHFTSTDSAMKAIRKVAGDGAKIRVVK